MFFNHEKSLNVSWKFFKVLKLTMSVLSKKKLSTLFQPCKIYFLIRPRWTAFYLALKHFFFLGVCFFTNFWIKYLLLISRYFLRNTSTEKMTRVHLIIFQHDNPCSAGNFSTRLTVSIPLIVLILFSFNTDSRVNEHA